MMEHKRIKWFFSVEQFSTSLPRVHSGSPGHTTMSLSLLSHPHSKGNFFPQWQNKSISNIAGYFLYTRNVTQNIEPKFHRITKYAELNALGKSTGTCVQSHLSSQQIMNYRRLWYQYSGSFITVVKFSIIAVFFPK